MRLKVASLMLFWFGFVAQLVTVWFVITDYYEYGYAKYLSYQGRNELSAINVISYTYFGFGHLVHVLAGYLLAKGTKKGILFGIGISIYEIVGAFSPSSFQYIHTASWVVIRIYFVMVIVIILAGRKELYALKTLNWRPWKSSKK